MKSRLEPLTACRPTLNHPKVYLCFMCHLALNGVITKIKKFYANQFEDISNSDKQKNLL